MIMNICTALTPLAKNNFINRQALNCLLVNYFLISTFSVFLWRLDFE